MWYLPLLFLLGLPILKYSDNTTDPDLGSDVQNRPVIEPTAINSSSNKETQVPAEEVASLSSSAEKGQRPSKEAYILLIGLSGAGKSSTLNFLFGNREITTSRVTDSTSRNIEIIEYIFKANGSDLDSELHIIDTTPGLSSSRAVDHDQRTLTALGNFLSNHPKLNNSVPNVVLLFSKFDDNRMEGNNSQFVSMLKGYERLKDQFTDSKKSNILFVFNRLLSETRSVAKKPASKLNLFRNIIKNYTSYPEPITLVVADNSIVEAEEPKKDNFGNFRLPNGDFYPKNIIDKMVESCQNRSDDSCVAVLQEVFAQRQTIEFTIANKQISSQPKSAESNSDIYSTRFEIETTPVSLALAEAYKSIDPELRNANPGSLGVLQAGLQQRGIKNLADVPGKAAQLILLLQRMNMDPAMVATFEKAFNLEVPRNPFEMLTGNGYDVVEDVQIKNSPFLFENYKFSEAGYMIPETMTMAIQDEDYNILNFHVNIKQMVESRSSQLGIQDKMEGYSSERHVRPGDNLISRWRKSSKEISVSAVHETRMFRLVLNNNSIFKREFQARIEQLPEFDLSDRNSASEWKRLFDDYGAYVVVSAYGGGAIETTVAAKDEERGKLRKKTFNSIRTIVESLPQYTRATKEFNNTWNTVEFQFTYRGGDLKYIQGSMTELDLPKANESLAGWKESLKTEPVMLENSIQLRPLSEFVKQINSSKAIQMESARVALLQGKLVFIELKENIVQATTEYSFPPTFEFEQGEIIGYENQRRLNDLELAIQKDRIERERLQEEILNEFRNFTRAAEASTRPPTTGRPRQRLPPARRPQAPPGVRTTTMPSPNTYITESELPLSLAQDSLKDGRFDQTGFSYDITRDKQLEHSPFQAYSEVGCKYEPYDQPNLYKPRPYYVYHNFETRQKYIDFRQQILGSGYSLNPSEYKGGIFPGHRILNPDSGLSIFIEYPVYKNMIRNGCHFYSADFVKKVRGLPYYDSRNCASKVQWRSFIEKYGMHFVNSSYLGGYIHIRPQGQFRTKILNTALNSQQELHSFFENLNWQDLDFQFEVVGGDTTILRKRNNFNKFDFVRWKKSLIESGCTSLRTDLTVTSLKLLFLDLKYFRILESFDMASNDYISGYLNNCNNGG